MTPAPRLRPAAVADHERLRALAFDSKAQLDYDREVVRRWANELRFGDNHERWVAEMDGEIVGWASLSPPRDGVAVLPAIWVDPAWAGRGIGTLLFTRVAERARELGARRLEWGAEPIAVGFYESVGGRFLREHVSQWGRAPWMGLDL